MPVNIDLNALLQDPQVISVIRILAAGLVAALIGLERTFAGKPAGMRTYGLVGMGAAMFTVVAIYGTGSMDYGSRVIGGIITGIGFLGAGTILHTRLHVVGLTTAAGMWVAAAIGMAMGLGMYAVGAVAGVLLFLLLQFASPEQMIASRHARELDPDLEFAEGSDLDFGGEPEAKGGIAWALAPTETAPAPQRRAPAAPQVAPAPPTTAGPAWSSVPWNSPPNERR